MPFAHSLCGLCLKESQRLHGEPLMTVTGKHYLNLLKSAQDQDIWFVLELHRIRLFSWG